MSSEKVVRVHPTAGHPHSPEQSWTFRGNRAYLVRFRKNRIRYELMFIQRFGPYFKYLKPSPRVAPC